MQALTITYRDQLFFVTDGVPPLKIGRGQFNDLVLQDPTVSEYHGQISCQGRTFIYKDLNSKNGTWIIDGRGRNLLIQHDEQELTGAGTIIPGSRSCPGLAYVIQEKSSGPGLADTDPTAFRIQKGLVCLDEKKYSSAVNIFEALIRESPEHIDLYRYAGFAAWKCNRLNDAALRYEQYLMLCRQDSAAMTDLGKIYERMGRVEQARDWYLKAFHAGEKEAGNLLNDFPRFRGFAANLTAGCKTVDLLNCREKSIHQSSHFIVTYFHDHLDILKTLLKNLESAYTNIGTILDFFPAKKIEVRLVSHYSEPCGRTSADGIDLYLSSHTIGENNFLSVLVNHEYCHFALGKLTDFSPAIPWWFHEGMAQFMSQHITPGRLLPIKALTEARQDLPVLDSLHKGPKKNNSTEHFRLAYLVAHGAVTYLINTHGTKKTLALIHALADIRNTAAAFNRVNLDYRAFTRQFSQWLINGAKTGRVKLTQKLD